MKLLMVCNSLGNRIVTDKVDTMEDDEEESDEILNQVLDEIGVDLNQQLGETPQGFAVPQTETRVAQAQPMGGAASGDDDLQTRLNNLKGDL